MNRAKKKAEKEGRPWIPEEYEQAMDNMEQEVMEGATGGKVDGGYRQPMVIGKFPARHMQLRSMYYICLINRGICITEYQESTFVFRWLRGHM